MSEMGDGMSYCTVRVSVRLWIGVLAARVRGWFTGRVEGRLGLALGLSN